MSGNELTLTIETEESTLVILEDGDSVEIQTEGEIERIVESKTESILTEVPVTEFIEGDDVIHTVAVLEQTSDLIELAEQGPVGPQGPSGAEASAYLHTQFSSASTWTVNHNLGYRPIAEVFNAGWAEVDASVVHTSVNQTVITFTEPITGFARLI